MEKPYILTGLIDTDIYILNQLEDDELYRFCYTNKYVHQLCVQNLNLKKRLINYKINYNKHLTNMYNRRHQRFNSRYHDTYYFEDVGDLYAYDTNNPYTNQYYEYFIDQLPPR